MNKDKILELLEDNGITDVEELKFKDEVLVLRFYYDFDEDEQKAAKAYANDESGEEEGNETWVEEFYKPYLSDLAIDNAGDVLEDVMEELQIEAQFIAYDIDSEDMTYNEFVGTFCESGKNVDIESVLEELGL